MRHLLIGSGAAALAAAEAIRRAEPAARLTLVTEEPHGFYSRPGLAYLLTGAVPAAQLQVRTRAEVEALGIERVTDRATLIRPDAQRVVLASGRELPYDRLLLATGARSITPDFPGASLPGIHLLDGLDQTMEILRQARRRTRAVVVGGGSTALEMVEGLHARGVETHYFLRGERFWSRTLDPEESALVEARLAAAGIRLHHRTEVARALERRGRLGGVQTTTGAIVPCELLCVATGVRPRTELARASGIAVDRGVLVDQYLETSAPGIHAAGDVAQVRDAGGGPAVLDTLWASAINQGRTAGENMAGARTAYRRPVPLNVTCLAGLVTTVMGDVGGEADPDLITITRGQSEGWHLGHGPASVTGHQGPSRIRLCLSERELTGAVVMGDQSLAGTVQQLIAERIDITPIRAELLRHPERLGPTLTRFADSLRGRVA